MNSVPPPHPINQDPGGVYMGLDTYEFRASPGAP